jgi:ankyrin repeat protein
METLDSIFMSCVTHLKGGRLAKARALIDKTPALKNHSIGDYSLLIYARRVGLPCLSRILEAGVNPDIQDTAGCTLLMDASANGDAATVDLLLRHGASVNVASSLNETAFSFACAFNQMECAQILFKYGAAINRPVAINSNPIDWVKKTKAMELYAWLVSVGAHSGAEN